MTARKASETREAQPDSAPTAIHAVQLLGRWMRVSRNHLALGAGCACGVGFGDLQMQDFEQHILDFLNSRHGTHAPVAALMRERAGYVAGQTGSVAELLRAIASRKADAPLEMQSAMLADMERTIESFEEQHPGIV